MIEVSKRAMLLLGGAGAALLAVQIAAAQSNNVGTIVPGQMIHVVKPGVATVDERDASPSVSTADASELASGKVSAGLVIIPTFDSTITSDPNAVAIEAAINTAIDNITSQFSDPITVHITFKKMATGLGQSSTAFYNYSYAAFLAALKGDVKTSDDATAVALLPSVSTNPVNGSLNINVKSANLRAVGINLDPGQDGTISLNTTITSPGSPGSTGAYSLLPVIEHEIDEVLGLGSSLPSVTLGTIFPEDLYRYAAVNTRSFTTANTFAFFSINASTFFAQFDNQNDGGDFGDWQSNPRPNGVPPKVQDAFATQGASPALSVELNALDVIGYDRAVPPVVTVDSVTPNAGASATQTFALAYSDSAGATDLSQTWVWFTPSFAAGAANSCMVYYNRAANTLNLLNDAGTVWQSAALGSATLQNSQCAIALGSSTATPSGNTLTVNLAMTFTPAFAGAMQVWLFGTNGGGINSSWQQRGTWTVPGGLPSVVTADSVTPNAGTGATQTFALAYSDTAGATDLSQTWGWFTSSFAAGVANSCMVYYNRAANTMNLLSDAGTVWQSAALGSGTLANSQCAIALGSSTAVPSANTLTVNLAMTFTPAFAGAKQVWLFATNGGGTNSSWQQRGTWTAAAPPVVTADSVTPNAGTGTTQTFALAYSDTAGATNLSQTWVWFNATFAASANSCMAYYDRAAHTVNLLNDAGTVWVLGTVGAAGTLQNSQCAVDLGTSTATPGVNTMTVSLAMTFKPPFAGPKNIYMFATNGSLYSGWQTLGSWTVP